MFISLYYLSIFSRIELSTIIKLNYIVNRVYGIRNGSFQNSISHSNFLFFIFHLMKSKQYYNLFEKNLEIAGV
jgi:hypothetical protein